MPEYNEQHKQDREDGRGKHIASSGWEWKRESVKVSNLVERGRRLTEYYHYVPSPSRRENHSEHTKIPSSKPFGCRSISDRTWRATTKRSRNSGNEIVVDTRSCKSRPVFG
jgi:hypothetical protein